MFTIYPIFILVVSFIVGLALTSYTLLSAVICFSFAIPLTKELNEQNVLEKNNPIIKRYTGSALFLTIVFFGITFLIYKFGSSVVQIGYELGFVYVFFQIIFDVKQMGVNQKNVSDYVETGSNTKYFNKISPSVGTPVEDVLNFIYIKVFAEHLNIVASKMARIESLDMSHKRWSQNEIKSRGLEIMKDAIKTEPETKEGKSARLESQKYAERITQLSKWKTS